MPTFSYTLSDFLPFTKIRASDFNSKFSDISTFLNGGIGNSNIADNSINRNTKLAVGTANYVIINDSNGKQSEEAQLAVTRGGLGFAPTISSGNAGKVVGVNDSGDALELRTTEASNLIEQLANVVTGITAGEALSTNDAVALINNEGTLKVVKASTASGDRTNSFVGFAKANATATPQIVTLTKASSWTTGTVNVIVNGRTYSQAFATSNDNSMTSLASAISADSDIQTAVASGSPEDTITLTSKGALTITVTSNSSGGAPTLTPATTQSPVGSSVRFQMFGALGGFSSLTLGTLYYLGASGAITASPTSLTVPFVGQALSSTVLFINPNKFNYSFGATDLFVRFYGTSSGAAGGAVQDVEHYNFSTWTAGTSSAAGTRMQVGNSESKYGSTAMILDGRNSGGTTTLLFASYNKTAWSTLTNRSTAKEQCATIYYNSLYWGNKGSTTNSSANGVTTSEKWNGSSWATGTAWGTAHTQPGNFSVGSLMNCIGGLDTGGSATTAHETKNSGDSLSSGTVFPTTSYGRIGTSAAGAIGIVFSHAGATNTTTAYTWNGSTWSAATAAAYSQVGQDGNGPGFSSTRGLTVTNGGATTSGSSPIATAQTYNGSSFSTVTSSSNSRSAGAGAAI